MSEENNEEYNNPIVIAGNNSEDIQKIVFSIVQRAVDDDEIEIQYSHKYESSAEYIVRIMRKGCGWIEERDGRGEREIKIMKCSHSDQQNFCSGPCAEKNSGKKCTKHVRNNCPHYTPVVNYVMTVKYVKIKKLGSIRGL